MSFSVLLPLSSVTCHLVPSSWAEKVSPECSLDSVVGWVALNATVCSSCYGSADWHWYCLWGGVYSMTHLRPGTEDLRPSFVLLLK